MLQLPPWRVAVRLLFADEGGRRAVAHRRSLQLQSNDLGNVNDARHLLVVSTCFSFAWYPGCPHCRLLKSSPALPLFCLHRFGGKNVCTAEFFRQFHVLLLQREAELGVWWVLADSTWKHSKNGNGVLRAFTALSRRAQKFSWLAFFCPPTEMHTHAHKHTHILLNKGTHSTPEKPLTQTPLATKQHTKTERRWS